MTGHTRGLGTVAANSSQIMPSIGPERCVRCILKKKLKPPIFSNVKQENWLN